MMRKVLVVDDENLIRLGIKSMIERHPNIKFDVMMCSNGIEALNIIDEEKIDILITDIRMPKMDGVGLINALKDSPDKPEMIILSGFDEFSYASEALRCGVRDYLLKPVKRTDLFDTLDKVEVHIKEKEQYLNNIKTAKSYMERYRVNELSYLFLKDNVSRKEILDTIEHIDIDILKDKFYLGIMKRKYTGVDCDVEEFSEEINDILDGYEGDEVRSYVTYLDSDKNLIILSRKLEVFLYIKEYLYKKNICKFFIGICDCPSGAEDIKDAYEKAKEALVSRLFFNNRYVIRYSEVSGKSKEFTVPKDNIERLANLLGTDRDKEVEKLVMEILDFNIIMRYDISYLQALSSEIKHVIISDVEKRYFSEQEVSFTNHEKLKNLNNYNCFPEYFHDLKDYIMDVNEYIKNVKDIYGDKKLIERAIEYIHRNYDKELNLALVSNEVSINYSYFSQVFKDYTGENFVNYVKRIRMEKAKELLKSPDFKVYEVACKVGYEDSKQFTKIFRKVTGISPREYRDKYIQD